MITTLDVYRGVLHELNKFNNPTFSLNTFNYFLNKSILQLEVTSYDAYAVTQKLTDDLRTLSSRETVDLSKSNHFILINEYGIDVTITAGIISNIVMPISIIRNYISVGTRFILNNNDTIVYKVTDISNTTVTTDVTFPGDVVSSLPKQTSISVIDSMYDTTIKAANQDSIIQFQLATHRYMHPLSVSITYKYILPKEVCDTDNIKYKSYGVKRSTEDMQSANTWNSYLKPSNRNPYYYVYSSDINTDVLLDSSGNSNVSNRPLVKLFIGTPIKNITPHSVTVVWLDVPQTYTLTEDSVYGGNSSEVIKFPDYLLPKIITSITSWILGEEADPRIGTFVQLNSQGQQQTVKK